MIRARELATDPEGRRALMQVAADLSDTGTREREFRALTDTMPAHRRAEVLLLTLTGSEVHAAQIDAPAGVTVRKVWEWMSPT